MHSLVIAVEVEKISLRNSLHSGSGVSGEHQRSRGRLNFVFLQSQIIIGKGWFHTKSMGVNYFDRNLPSFTDHVVLLIINILSQCIADNLSGSMK